MSQPLSTSPAASNRRDFLKTSTIAAVGAGVLGSLGGLPRAFAGGDDLIKIGLIGCGGRGTGAARQALSTQGNVKLIAMGDAFPDRLNTSLKNLEKNFQQHPERVAVDEDHRFIGFDAYNKVLASGVDLVILATPPGFRPIHFDAAVKAGKHVFMEKPVAVDAPGVRAVLAAVAEAKKKNLGVGVGLQRHHDAGYIETLNRLRDGAIGDIHSARVYWNSAGVWVKPRQASQTEMEYQMRNWYYFNWLCGDHIVEQHIHNIDVINWLKGAYPVSANGMGGRQVRVGKDYGEIFDHHDVEFEYADGSRMFSQCRHIPNTWSSVSEHVQGTKGTADISAYSIKGPNEWRFNKKGKKDPYQVEHDDLFASIRAGTPNNEGEYGALSTMTAIFGRMATYSGKVVKWDEALASNLSLAPKEYDFKANPPVLPGPDGMYAAAVPGVSRVI
jgi:predicted dehydrogenase